MRISIVVPVYNESENVRLLAEKIEETVKVLQPEFWEALFVNDGSVDRTGELIDALASNNPGFRAIHFDRNYGQTAAMDAGIRAAKGEFVITMDGDLQNDPKDMGKLIRAMGPKIGCVAGFREKRNDSWIRRVSSRIANGVRNRLSNENIRDTGCSLKVFRKSVLDNIKLFEGMHRFLPTLVKMEGYEVVEVAVGHYPRFAGESKYGVWNRLFKSFYDLLAVRWMKRRMLGYKIRIDPTGDASGISKSNGS